MYFDAHTHLNDDKLFDNWQTYLENFVNNGGKGLIIAGVDEIYNKRGIEICKNYTKRENCVVKTTIGYHPAEVCFGNIKTHNIKEKILSLTNLYRTGLEHIVGIGECGIDTHYEKGKETIKLQKEVFGLQCEIAQELKLPVIIHSRNDFASTMDVIENYKNLKIYFHCWGYGPEEIEIVTKKLPQVRIGFCGNITYPKAEHLRESILKTPLGCILLETDAPYLTPQKYRGQDNQPGFIKNIYEFVNDFLRNKSDNLGTIVNKNRKEFFLLENS